MRLPQALDAPQYHSRLSIERKRGAGKKAFGKKCAENPFLFDKRCVGLWGGGACGVLRKKIIAAGLLQAFILRSNLYEAD